MSHQLIRLFRWHFCAALLLLLAPAAVQAHSGPSAPIQTFVQTIGRHEVTVTLSLPATAPAPLAVSVIVPPELGEATITLRAALRGRPFDGRPAVRLSADAGPPPTYSGQVALEQPGEWDLEVLIEGAGGGVARLPFTILPASLPPYTVPLMAALGTLVTLLIAGIVLSNMAERGAARLPGWASLVLQQGIFASLLLSAVFGYLQFSANLQAAQAGGAPIPASPASTGRPHANIALRSEPAEPLAGQPLLLTFELSDGGTGQPLDDLVTHHEALIHLLVIDESGAEFHHLHPARIAPGRYSVELTPGRAGRYTAYTEIEREDSGTQMLSRDFAVGGPASATPVPAPGLGQRQLSDLLVTVSSARPAVAGRQTTLTVSFSQRGQPVVDIQPWLGMAGHLIARSADRAIIAHVHAAEQMVPSALIPSAVRYGPDIRFAYTFPQPGSYQLWFQFKHNDRILTVPLALQVAE